ncbi:MAG: tyrosine-type recombinase/integrase [Amphritea sp.]
MAARPRKQTLTSVPNLYVKRDKRTGKLSCQYKDVRTNTFHGLGANLQIAEQQARHLNAIISQQLIDKAAAAILSRDSSDDLLVTTWIKKYISILEERRDNNEIKEQTFTQTRSVFLNIEKTHGKMRLSALNTVVISTLLSEYTKSGKARMAQRIRTGLIDFFAEAIAAGHYPADKPNPARVTKAPKAKIKRARLTLDVFKQAINWAKENQPPHLWRAYLLAALTGQRRGDISHAKFKDVRIVDGVEFIGFIQIKTGTKILIPIDLKLDSIGCSIREIVSSCRDRVVSQYLFHHAKPVGRAKAGDPIAVKAPSYGFAEAIKALDIDWGKNDPPSFHEIRSLAGREYAKQGLDIQKLLGHKHLSTTEIYADARGHEWIKVSIN